MSAIRFTIATNQITSPAAARATSSRRPCSLCRPARTNRSASACRARASAPAGSARSTAAASRFSNRAQPSDPANAATAPSTSAAASTGRCRVACATLRAFPARISPSCSRRHNRGSRCRKSSASATRRSALPDVVSNRAPSSARQNPATSGVPAPPTSRPSARPGTPARSVRSPG